MKRVIAICLAVLMMISLCACGTTEKWLIMEKTDYSGEKSVITYTYDDYGNVSEVFETDFSDGTWFKTIIKDNKINSVESNYNEVYADEGYELIISVEGDNEYTLQLFYDDVLIRKVTNTLNDSGNIVKSIVIQYNQGYRMEIIRSFDKNNAITAIANTQYDLDTNEVLDQSIETYYCTYDSNQLPIAAYYSYMPDSPAIEYVWDLVEVKK